MNAPSNISKAEFIVRFQDRLQTFDIRVSEAIAAGYWLERNVEPDYSPEQWADAHRTHGGDPE